MGRGLSIMAALALAWASPAAAQDDAGGHDPGSGHDGVPSTAAGHAGAGHTAAAPAKGKPKADSDAPPGAPPHWIPADQWVLNHWLPYDEARLLALLKVDRTTLWRHLRDDRRNLAKLARARGWEPRELAVALVAPRRLEDAQQRELEARALRTLSQGHMAQHILFHTLHQEVVPRRARDLFGVDPARFRLLRRLDLSPLEIARAAGRTRLQVERATENALRATARRGVRNGAVSQAQASLTLDRQLRQLPRWLEHRRYNGPPPTDDRTGKLEEPLLPHALAPSISADGRLVSFDHAQPKIPLAAAQGEIAVEVRTVSGRPVLDPAPVPAGAPCSAYASRLAGRGRFAVVETSAGNMTFGKRYGELGVVRVDLRTGRTRTVSPAGSTAYRPVISADGATIAFALSPPRGPRAQVAVWRDGRLTVLPGVAHEPVLSGDGRTLAFTRAEGERTVVVRRNLVSGAEQVLRLPGRSDAGEPALSHDGRTVAFTAGPRVWVGRGDWLELQPAGSTRAHSPALSPDGRYLATSRRSAEVSESGRPVQTITVRDLRTGRVRDAGRAAPGAYLAHPSLARGGRTLALTAVDRAGVQQVRVVDVRSGRSRLVSGPATREGALPSPCAIAPPVW